MAFAVHVPMGGGSTSNNGRHQQNGHQTTAARGAMAPVTTADWSNAGSSTMTTMAPADEVTIDGYAMKVLEDASPSDVSVDADYLGPYITGVIRAEQPSWGATSLEELPDYDNVLELLQEHCGMARKDAKEALKKISQAVMAGMVPIEYLYSSSSSTTNNNHNNANGAIHSPALGPFRSPPSSLNGTGLTAMQLLETVNVEAAAQAAPSAEGAQTLRGVSTPINTNLEGTAASVLSPAQANNLIPVDLLGAIDDYDEDPAATLGYYHNYPGNIPESATATSDPLEEEFPSLAVAAATTSKLSKKASRVSRSRQGSIDDSSISEHSSKKISPHLQPQIAPPLLHQQQHQQQLLQQNAYFYGLDVSNSDPATMLQMACDMLQSMNPDMGQDAIFQAATMAQSDVGVAQYLMDCAMTAPPVCRHLLQSGCYRADCSFSHDLEGHTCVFWLRGRCTKASSCQFLHGYNEKWLLQLEEQQQEHEAEMEQAYLAQQQQQQQEYHYPPNNYESWNTTDHDSNMPNNQGASSSTTNSFANIASQGYNDQTCFQKQSSRSSGSAGSISDAAVSPIYEETKFSPGAVPTMKIPQDVWNPHERRDASAFHIMDPLERYREVMRHHTQQVSGVNSRQQLHFKFRTDVIDLHFQSTKTFAVVLEHVLPEKLATETQGVWIVTGTGHHVGTKTHQKGGGVLESACMSWLTEHGYDFWKGRDRNGHGGALFVKKMIGIDTVQ